MEIPKDVVFNGVKYSLVSRGRYYLSQSNSNAGRKILKDCMLQFGNIFQERKYLLGMRFITKTATLLITTSAILSVYQFVNTARQPISKLKKFASTLTRFGISLLPGTRVKKAESGIEITLGKKNSKRMHMHQLWSQVSFQAS